MLWPQPFPAPSLRPPDHLRFHSFTGAQTGTLGTITTSGVFTPIGTTGSELFGLAFSPTGVLYGAGQDTPGGTITLYTVNPATAALTVVGSTGLNGGLLSEEAAGLAFGPNGTLFLADTNPNGTSSNLYTVNTGTGAVTQLGPIGNMSQGTIGFDGSGNLYEINNETTPNHLDLLDTTSGMSMSDKNTAFSDVFGLAFSNGQLFGFANSGNRVITLNTATGIGTQVATFNTGGTGIIIAATPFVAVPDPLRWLC